MAAPNRQSVHATKVVPWLDRNEFLGVYSDLFSDDLQIRRYGVDKVAVWKSRVQQDLSIAIESSAALISVLCDHEEAQKAGTTRYLDDRLRSMYSMALIRFVNHVTQRGQTKYYAMPVHELALQCGIPLWIVRLRHDATHRNLPSLDLLYSGAILALQWLHSDFWISNLPETLTDQLDDDESANTVASRSRLRRIIQTFADARCRELQTSPDINSHEHELMVELQNCLTETNKKHLISSIMDDGHVFSNKYFDLLDINEEDVACSGLLLPAQLFNLWQPLLRTLNKLNLLSSLCEMMIRTLTNDSTLRNRLVAGWLLAVCRDGLGCKKLFNGRTLIPWKQLLLLCLQNPNQFTHSVTEILIKRTDKGQFHEKAELLRCLLSVYNTDAPITADYHHDGSTYSIGDISALAQPRRIGTGSEEHSSDPELSSVGGMWQLSHIHTKWSSIPFGVLPGQNLTYGSLELSGVDTDTGVTNADHSTEDRVGRREDFDMMDTLTDTEINNHNPWSLEHTETLKQTVVLF
ncbi:ribosomal biogenesis protein LAS1L-like [Gigantopelta aegis]|uniref:ribosomal biogenesis protein LAS1L-like n=1 Tax=Gigantopelta aegis TaxID=1735272 RepID=UPI001B88C987|nr:ribosomal biogenesis protein LAS1L-like [Gigantopelta aegis]